MFSPTVTSWTCCGVHFCSETTFDLQSVVSRISRIASPGRAPDLISMMQTLSRLQPSEQVRALKAKVLGRKIGGIVIAALTLFLVFNGMVWGFLALIPAAILFFGGESGRNDIFQRKSQAEQWQEALRNWQQQAGPGAFEERRAELGRIAKIVS